MKKSLILLAMSLWLGHAAAEEMAEPQTDAERPEVSEGQVPEGEVIIRSDGGTKFYEYLQGGQVYKVKVVPKKGRPYFLVDSDGNGSLDQIQWILVSW